ncbi:RHS repeat-associated core domain-containing protein [Pseudomonas sichuanensis]|uniref:RHS repeat-associated core domain-containing protein n=1 Tax=Pseudomonas sichuanensis TaxID=2213015 RepID=UPI00244A9A34|nr:RHS repeat-associated core domain-containing protein [Pseudomonas sichuanensis]MDH0731029.1 RHS repeat-associated core domain-containing protein [Pseudomonas sichuanensis]MDH1580994.1 RHS repeat-associated core domain-containing protein [Pseudomonas sichuanensis]MDH1591145.1 RHS repeat-associated core domain-containing protein [Pseudomonas sichuanensis]MDH1596814.1 RHS repeat-associated core domain-containing protein [Pseudomonas sichuanensis]
MPAPGQQLFFYSPEGVAFIKHDSTGYSVLLRAAGQVLAQRGGGQVGFYVTDRQGSVLQLVGRDTHWVMAYTPYGRDSVEGSASMLRFSGQRKETVTGHYLLGNGYRAFSSVLMRFIAPDNLSPFGAGGRNCFAYCDGDPVNKTDPSGHGAPLVATLPSIRTKAGLAKSAVSLNPDFLGKTPPYRAVSKEVVATVNGLGRGYGNQIEPLMNAPLWSDADKLLVQGSTLKLTSTYGENLKRVAGANSSSEFANVVWANEQQKLLQAINVLAPLNKKMQASESFVPVDSWLHSPARRTREVRE